MIMDGLGAGILPGVLLLDIEWLLGLTTSIHLKLESWLNKDNPFLNLVMVF
jgi:hypothetical protein